MRVSTLLPLYVLLPTTFGQLNKLAKANGLKYFGSATDNPELTNTQYVAILSNTSNFGQITPGNTQKWAYTEPTQGTFAFAEGDVITAFAKTNGQMLRCHNLVWYNELPSWGMSRVSLLCINTKYYKSLLELGRMRPSLRL